MEELTTTQKFYNNLGWKGPTLLVAGFLTFMFGVYTLAKFSTHPREIRTFSTNLSANEERTGTCRYTLLKDRKEILEITEGTSQALFEYSPQGRTTRLQTTRDLKPTTQNDDVFYMEQLCHQASGY